MVAILYKKYIWLLHIHIILDSIYHTAMFHGMQYVIMNLVPYLVIDMVFVAENKLIHSLDSNAIAVRYNTSEFRMEHAEMGLAVLVSNGDCPIVLY